MTQLLEQQLQTILSANIPITRVSQGAEAVVYRTSVHPYLDNVLSTDPARLSGSDANANTKSYIIKYRPPKTYRHPTLDAQLTKHRTLAEARLLQKLGYAGVNVPEVVHVDFHRGVIWMEDIVGSLGSLGGEDDGTREEMRGSLKNWIWDYEREHFGEKERGYDTEEDAVTRYARALVERVGREIGKLHMNDIVHGDLTTSNILLRREPGRDAERGLEPVLIDFGLGSVSALAEDKAVDLYVLERAVGSTHPVNSEVYCGWLLHGYRESCLERNGGSKFREVEKKLKDVRLRGRKRSMLG